MREAHVVDPQLEVLAVLRDGQLVVVHAKVEREVALELLLVAAKHAVAENTTSA